MADREEKCAEGKGALNCVDQPVASGSAINVVDDLPLAIPLSAAELEAIVSYLGPLLDSLLDASPCNVTEACESAPGGDAVPA